MNLNLYKKALFICCTLLTFSFAKAQYGIEVNYGLNGVIEPSNSNFSHFGGGITYDFDETYGLKLDFGSDKFRIDNPNYNEKTGLDITRISLQGTVNLSSALTRASSYDTFNILAHAGAGYSLIKSSIHPGNDNTVNLIAGITPRFRISEGLYFAIDVATIFNISQHYNFDGEFSYTDTLNSFTGITYNVTGGIVYKFNEY